MIQKLSQHNSLNRQAYLLGIPKQCGDKSYQLHHTPGTNYSISLYPSLFCGSKPGNEICLYLETGLRFFGLAAWPIITLHCLLLSYSSQGFTSLYMAYFLSVLVGVFYHKLHNIKLLPLKTSLTLLLLCLGISLIVLQTMYI